MSARQRTPLAPAPRGMALVALLVVSACAPAINYVRSDGPGYTGDYARPHHPSGSEDSPLKVVSYNVEFARRVSDAIALLRTDPELRDADILLLQEMDERGTRAVARALELRFVYYPASRAGRTDRDFGNAVLSRWPIVQHEKLILPHLARWRGTQRTATAATLHVGGTPVRVYSAHLGTALEIGGDGRRDQLAAILDDAERHPHVIVGGDMNSQDVGSAALDRGFVWPTRDGPWTTALGRFDHIFLKGVDGVAAGAVRDTHDASDHRPVWAVVLVPRPQRQPARTSGGTTPR